MKTVMGSFLALLLLITGQSCTSNESRYADLNTGMSFHLVKDPQTGLMVDAQTGKPLNIYIDKLAGDTVNGPTGKIINGEIARLNKHYYAYIGADNREVNQSMASHMESGESESRLKQDAVDGMKTVSHY